MIGQIFLRYYLVIHVQFSVVGLERIVGWWGFLASFILCNTPGHYGAMATICQQSKVIYDGFSWCNKMKIGIHYIWYNKVYMYIGILKLDKFWTWQKKEFFKVGKLMISSGAEHIQHFMQEFIAFEYPSNFLLMFFTSVFLSHATSVTRTLPL